jgi:hypothetical protein
MASLSLETTTRSAHRRPLRSGARPARPGWEGAALRAMEYIAYPALAGCALLVLALGVVTWPAALAAAAHALQRWRRDGHGRPFLGTLQAFVHYWPMLWKHGVGSAAAAIVLTANLVFLTTRTGPAALVLLALQVGLVLALVPYHLALAAIAARNPGGRPDGWVRGALVLAFGSPRRGLGLLAATGAAVLLTAPLALGPFLFGPTLPLLVGLWLADRVDEAAPTVTTSTSRPEARKR